MNENPRRVVLDTDTFNEVDDQFALAHLILSAQQVTLEAVYAAPFFIPGRSAGPADGMEKSYEEIQRVLELTGVKPFPPVFRGSTAYLPDATTPVESAAAIDLVERAMKSRGEKLYVVGIAAATNIASALLLEPRIAERIVIVWLGGHAPYWPNTDEFNLGQDIHAARVLLASKAQTVLIPCFPVASHLLVSPPELEKELAPYSKLGAYLTRLVTEYGKGAPGWSKPIWDISASAYVINPAWTKADTQPAPILTDELTWQSDFQGHSIQVARELDRNAIFADFFAKARLLGP